jgi:hypothetical protein
MLWVLAVERTGDNRIAGWLMDGVMLPCETHNHGSPPLDLMRSQRMTMISELVDGRDVCTRPIYMHRGICAWVVEWLRLSRQYDRTNPFSHVCKTFHPISTHQLP